MNTDQELIEAKKRLYQIALNHYKGKNEEGEIDEALLILRDILIYAHKVNEIRSVQILQIEENVSCIRRVLNQPPLEGHFPYVSHYIDNLLIYCGAKIY
jgi:hypothetical protein